MEARKPISVNCGTCGMVFTPNLRTRAKWLCVHCRAKNPNLKRHYRSIAILCILALLVTIMVLPVQVIETGVTLGAVVMGAHALLLLSTIICIYKSPAPWMDQPVKTLIWVVFVLALFFNLVLPFLLAGLVNIPFLVVYAIVFPYLFWLSARAKKCTVREAEQQSDE